jgi:hypothetical protein
MMAIETGKWLSAIRREQIKAHRVRHEAVKVLGNYARDRVRSRIPPSATEPAGIAFPGNLAKGHLKSHFKAYGATKTPNESRMKMGLAPGAGKMARIKAYVHEYGKRIYAKKAPFLVFKIGDKWIRVKSVYIQPKAYFSTGWRAAHAGASAILNRYMQANWGK